MKIAVLTSLFGARQPLRCLAERELDYQKDVDFIAYVDEERPESKGWTQIVSPVFSTDIYKYRRSAKLPKILPQFVQPEYDAYLWIDSCQIPRFHPLELYDKFLKGNDMALFQHPIRDCLYQEGLVCAQIGRDDPQLIKNQLQEYAHIGVPQNYGLNELACFMMSNNDITKELSLTWWEQICRYSSRDQISFPFVLYKMRQMNKDVKTSIIPGYIHDRRSNDYFQKIREPRLMKKH